MESLDNPQTAKLAHPSANFLHLATGQTLDSLNIIKHEDVVDQIGTLTDTRLPVPQFKGKTPRALESGQSEQNSVKRSKNSLKSRNGCNTCKRKRLKCDEKKPSCNNCLKKNIVCGGYATRYKWRVFNEVKEEAAPIEAFAGRNVVNGIPNGTVNHTVHGLANDTASLSNCTVSGRTNSIDDSRHSGPYIPGQKLAAKLILLSEAIMHKSNICAPLKLPTVVKQEDSDEMRPLLLHDHLELASLSVVGKSSKEIEFENNLLAKGINPNSYYPPNFIGHGVNAVSPVNTANAVNTVNAASAVNIVNTVNDVNGANTIDNTNAINTVNVGNIGHGTRSSSFSVEVKQKMHRSFSSHEVVSEQLSSDLQRSRSMSYYQVPTEVQNFRAAHASDNLHSLAEVAVDEIRTRSPASASAHMSLTLSDGTTPEALPVTHFYGEKTPRIPSAIPTPKPWLFNPAHIDPVTGVKDFLPDINLTPSLSAIMSYAFSDDAHKHQGHANTKHMTTGEVAPSPLDLNIHALHDIGSPVDRRRLSVSSLHKIVATNLQAIDTTNESNQLLYEVGCQLMKVAHLSPSIVRNASSESLLRSSEREQILLLYSTYTCGIMSIKSGATENPWKNLYIPLTSDYPYLFNSIASMTLFHLASNTKIGEKSAQLRSKGYAYMKSCILELASGLSKMENNINCEFLFPADVALATCLNLAVSESWDTHISSGIAHLKGANSMIQKVISVIKQYLSVGRKKKPSNVPRSVLKKKLVFVSDEEWSKIEDFDNENQDSSIQDDMYIPRNLQLLFNQWIYFEVLSQMTCYNGQDVKGIDLVSAITKNIQTTEKKRDEEIKSSRSSDNFNSPSGSLDLHHSSGARKELFHYLENFDAIIKNVDYVDPLLGCAQSLFLIMGRVANLISKVRISKENDKKQVRNSLSNISQASELKQQLVDWRPNVSAQMAELGSKEAKDSSWDFYSCISTAEAYRYATLLYLHEAVPEVPLISSHQLAEKIFVLLASIPSNSNLFIVHIFPLLVSSCEAEPGEERDWCLARWMALSERLWIGNIDRAFEVVKEVWKRKDEQVKQNKESTVSEKLDLDDPRDFSVHLHGLMSSINKNKVQDDRGIISKTHWSTIMMEWGWEVLLA